MFGEITVNILYKSRLIFFINNLNRQSKLKFMILCRSRICDGIRIQQPDTEASVCWYRLSSGFCTGCKKLTDRAGKSPFDTLQNYHNRAIVIIIITNNITHNSVIKPLLCYYTARKYCQNAAYFLLILAYTTLKPQIAHTGRFGILVPYKLTLLSNK